MLVRVRRRVHHTDPLIETVDGVVTPVEARHLQGIATPVLATALVSSGTNGVTSAGRTNSVSWVRHDHDATTWSIAGRISDLVNMPLANAESFQVIRYGVGERYREHLDAYDLTTERGQRCCRLGGQRLVTVLGYLSDVDEGGSTRFPKIGLDIQPRLGRVVIFENCGEDRSRPQPNSLHAGTKVLAGEKWAFNLWFHERDRSPGSPSVDGSS